MLLASTPVHTWTSVGNGTYNGIYHELHFKHTNNTAHYRATQNSYPKGSALSARQLYWCLNRKQLVHCTGKYVKAELCVPKLEARVDDYRAPFNDYIDPISFVG